MIFYSREWIRWAQQPINCWVVLSRIESFLSNFNGLFDSFFSFFQFLIGLLESFLRHIESYWVVFESFFQFFYRPICVVFEAIFQFISIYFNLGSQFYRPIWVVFESFFQFRLSVFWIKFSLWSILIEFLNFGEFRRTFRNNSS